MEIGHPKDVIDGSAYVSIPADPGSGDYCFSGAPASPMHYILFSKPYSAARSAPSVSMPRSCFEFEFSAEYHSAAAAVAGSMVSADELFLNGQIRPMKPPSGLKRLDPLLHLDVEEGGEEGRGKGEEATAIRVRELAVPSTSLRRRTRSMSLVRNSRFQWADDEEEEGWRKDLGLDLDTEQKHAEAPAAFESSAAASSSRSSSFTGRSSKRWDFLKDLLHRSKSEGRASGKEKLRRSVSTSPSSKENSRPPPPPISESRKQQKNAAPWSSASYPGFSALKRAGSSSKPASGAERRRTPSPSPHERHYTMNRAVAEEMRRRTPLPYRQGVIGCLGFSSSSYAAMRGFAKALNTVSAS